MLALNFRTPDGSTEVDLLVSESDQLALLRERAVTVVGPKTCWTSRSCRRFISDGRLVLVQDTAQPVSIWIAATSDPKNASSVGPRPFCRGPG